jgi:ParB/RepB/Spo0J family partition protein
VFASLPVSSIRNGNQLRTIRDAEIEQLRESLTTEGQLCPIRVRPLLGENSAYEVIFGNRRLIAARSLGWDTIKAEIVNVSDEDALLDAFRENNDRKDLSDYERALALELIHKRTGKSYAELARLIGRSAAYVYQHVSMLSLFAEGAAPADEVKNVLSSLTEKHARVLARVEDYSKRWEIAKLAVRANLAVRELERFCQTTRRQQSLSRDSNRNQIEQVIQEAMQGLSSCDVSKFLSTVSKRNFSMFTSHPPFHILEREEAVSQIMTFMKNFHSYVIDVKDLQMRIVGNLAYCMLQCDRKMNEFEYEKVYPTRATMVLEKEEGQWKIVHAHWSCASVTGVVELVTAMKGMFERKRYGTLSKVSDRFHQ